MNLEPIREVVTLGDRLPPEPHFTAECMQFYLTCRARLPAVSLLLEAVTRVIEYESKLRESSQAMLKLGDTYGSGLQAGLADSLHALIHLGDEK